jgi:ferritin heavy chain
MSKVRQNYHTTCEALVNKQVNMEFYASYVYMSMATYFSREDIALHGFAKRFFDSSADERQHGLRLIEYQNMRGGRVVFQDIAKPNRDEWGTALEAIEASLELEKTVNQSIIDMHKAAEVANDAQMTDFLEGEYLKEQVEDIKRIADLVAQMKRAGTGVGLHIIDKELLA